MKFSELTDNQKIYMVEKYFEFFKLKQSIRKILKDNIGLIETGELLYKNDPDFRVFVNGDY